MTLRFAVVLDEVIVAGKTLAAAELASEAEVVVDLGFMLPVVTAEPEWGLAMLTDVRLWVGRVVRGCLGALLLKVPGCWRWRTRAISVRGLRRRWSESCDVRR